MIGAKGGPYLKKGEWQVFTGYRYQKSDRHFRGSHEEPNRQAEGSEVINNIHLIDLAATYAVNERFNMTVSVPLLFAERSNPIRSGGVVVDRSLTQANGVSDMSVMGRFWVGHPESHANQNLSLGVGIKLPTGNSNVQDVRRTLTSSRIGSVDQSIQPGDGGVGMTLDIQGFKLLFGKATLFGSAAYLVNPLDTNDTLTGRGRPSEAIMSVADQYLARVGVALPVSVKHGLGAAIAARIEGVPSQDLIGKSNGFRRPGYAVSIEPTALWSIGGNNISFSVPVAVFRNRTRSTSDILVGGHGDAAFADYFFLVGWSRRF